MASAVLISIEGVLSKEGPPNGAPYFDALDMIVALRTRFKVVFSTTCEDKDHVDHWMNIVGLRDPVVLLGFDAEEYDVRMAHFEQAMRADYLMAMVIDTNPSVCAEIMRRGTVSMLYAHPRFARPEDRPEDGLKPWSVIEDEITAQRKLRPDEPVVDAEMEPV